MELKVWIHVLIAACLTGFLLLSGCDKPRGCDPGRKCCPQPAKSYVIAFSATWCGPCQMAEPRINALVAAGVDVRKVDIDAFPALAGKWRVTAVPTFIVIRRGRESARTNDVSDLGRLLGRARQ